ncbi:hypothetical protein [Actinoallomurus sp. NPDC050550]|uniref:hypothetical protein n=1 Tax=Actinoallomurus sp. NPDC050550 TaxID=3154937 RepID=UPI0033D7F9A9
MASEQTLPSWAARLQAERERRSWNKHEMARRLQKATGRPYPPVTSLVRQILGWEKGEHFPRDWTAAYAWRSIWPKTICFRHPAARPPAGRTTCDGALSSGSPLLPGCIEVGVCSRRFT